MTLETLLNKLIEIGRKPFGKKTFGIRAGRGVVLTSTASKGYMQSYEYSYNDLCSLESGLRQFVCEKKLYTDGIKKEGDKTSSRISRISLESGHFSMGKQADNPKYRVMLSSIQEDKEDFILDNIQL